MRHPHGETITVLSAPLIAGGWGTDEERDWANATQRSVEGVAIAPRRSGGTAIGGEVNIDRTAVIVGLTIYPPPDANIDPHDRVVIDNEPYEVVGEPGDWSNPFTGSWPGSEIALKRVTG